MRTLTITIVLLISFKLRSQNYPSYLNEKEVNIIGLTFDAMEPFISSDRNYLFFNNLNDGNNTKLYYATRVNDSTFNFVGEIGGTNQTIQPHLDAVADMDSSSVFYWTSTRNYPNQLDNLHRGIFSGGNVTSINRVHGDFNVGIPGWLVMDHGISYDGQLLYYNNARFDGLCTGPCETHIGIAQKINDSTFNKTINSDFILSNINDTNYIYYATFISSDNLELYYTRYLKGPITPSTAVEICVSVRNSSIDTFSVPAVLFSDIIANIVEAPCLTNDKTIMYYHKKVGGIHKIMMRNRNIATNVNTITNSPFIVYPNPTKGVVSLLLDNTYSKIKVVLTNSIGQVIIKKQYNSTNFIELFVEAPKGVYFLQLETDNIIKVIQIVKE